MPRRSILACELFLAALGLASSAAAQDVIAGGANLLHRASIEYPREAAEKRIQGPVTVAATLNGRGIVTDAYVINGPEPLRKPVLKSVLEWHYQPGTPSPVQIAVDFTLEPVVKKGPILLNGVPVAEDQIPPPQPAKDPPNLDAGTLGRIRFTGVSSTLEEALLRKLPVREGDVFQTHMVDRISDAVREFDEHLAVNYDLLDFDGEKRLFGLRISYSIPIERTGPSAK